MTFGEWWKVAGSPDWELVRDSFRDCWNTAMKMERAACEKIALDRWEREREPEVKSVCLEIAEQIGERQISQRGKRHRAPARRDPRIQAD